MKATIDHVLGASVVVMSLCAVVLTGFTAKTKYDETQPPTPSYLVADWLDYASRGHRIGPPSAKLTIVMFSDYQCPACKEAMEILEAFQSKHPSLVSVVLRHYPIVIHPYAEPAARAAVCAEQQGRFRETNKLLFAKADPLALTFFTQIAAQAGVADTVAFDRCMAHPGTAAAVAADVAAGREINILGTPTLLLDGEQYTGTRGLHALLKQKAKSAQKGGTLASGR